MSFVAFPAWYPVRQYAAFDTYHEKEGEIKSHNIVKKVTVTKVQEKLYHKPRAIIDNF